MVGSSNSTAAGTICTSFPSLKLPSPLERVTRIVLVLIELARTGSLKVTISSDGGVFGVLLGPGETVKMRGPVVSVSRLPTPEVVEEGSCHDSALNGCACPATFDSRGALQTKMPTTSAAPPNMTSSSTALMPWELLNFTLFAPQPTNWIHGKNDSSQRMQLTCKYSIQIRT